MLLVMLVLKPGWGGEVVEVSCRLPLLTGTYLQRQVRTGAGILLVIYLAGCGYCL
jgi:hypothetical protein